MNNTTQQTNSIHDRVAALFSGGNSRRGARLGLVVPLGLWLGLSLSSVAQAQCIIPGSEGCVGEPPTSDVWVPAAGGLTGPALAAAVEKSVEDKLLDSVKSIGSSRFQSDPANKEGLNALILNYGDSPNDDALRDAVSSIASQTLASPYAGGVINRKGEVENTVANASAFYLTAAEALEEKKASQSAADIASQPTVLENLLDTVADAVMSSVSDTEKYDRTFPTPDLEKDSAQEILEMKYKSQEASQITKIPSVAAVSNAPNFPPGEPMTDEKLQADMKAVLRKLEGSSLTDQNILDGKSPVSTSILTPIVSSNSLSNIESSMRGLLHHVSERVLSAPPQFPDSLPSLPAAFNTSPSPRTVAAASRPELKIQFSEPFSDKIELLSTYADEPQDSPFVEFMAQTDAAGTGLRAHLESNTDQVVTPYKLTAITFEASDSPTALSFNLEGALYFLKDGKGFVFEPVAFDQAEIADVFQDFGVSSFEDKGAQLRINDENGQLLLSAQFDFLGFEATDSSELTWSWPAEGDESDLDYTLEVNYSAGIKQRLQPAIALPTFDLAAAEKFNLLTLVDRTDGSVIMNGQRFRPAYTVNALTSGQNAYAKKVGGSQNVAFMEGDVNGDGKLDYTLYMADIGSQVLYGL